MRETPPAHPAPRLGDLAREPAAEVVSLYSKLGGRRESPALLPGPWDVQVDRILVDVDEQLHFNRYGAMTLTTVSYQRLPRFPLAVYRAFGRSERAIWDSLPGVPGVTIEDVGHRIPERRFSEGIRALFAERARASPGFGDSQDSGGCAVPGLSGSGRE